VRPTPHILSQNLTNIQNTVATEIHPDYLKVNPMGTVPSLTVPSLSKPLTDSRDVLAHLDSLKPAAPLVPTSPAVQENIQAIIDIVHGDDVSTNLILLQARDMDEYSDKGDGPFGAYIATRQKVLEKHNTALPEHAFYGPEAEENGMVHKIYTVGSKEEREAFFKDTHESYKKFAGEIDRLGSLIVLSYAGGREWVWLTCMLCLGLGIPGWSWHDGDQGFEYFGKAFAEECSGV
jgi:hypothetical protein